MCLCPIYALLVVWLLCSVVVTSCCHLVHASHVCHLLLLSGKIANPSKTCRWSEANFAIGGFWLLSCSLAVKLVVKPCKILPLKQFNPQSNSTKQVRIVLTQDGSSGKKCWSETDLLAKELWSQMPSKMTWFVRSSFIIAWVLVHSHRSLAEKWD